MNDFNRLHLPISYAYFFVLIDVRYTHIIGMKAPNLISKEATDVRRRTYSQSLSRRIM